jgi:hypothetical protein
MYSTNQERSKVREKPKAFDGSSVRKFKVSPGIAATISGNWRSRGDLVVKVLDASTDECSDKFGLPVGLVEFILANVDLIESNIHVALDFSARPQGDIEKPPLVLKGVPSMGLCNIPHRRDTGRLHLPAQGSVGLEWLASRQAIDELHKLPRFLPTHQIFESLNRHQWASVRTFERSNALPEVQGCLLLANLNPKFLTAKTPRTPRSKGLQLCHNSRPPHGSSSRKHHSLEAIPQNRDIKVDE